MRRLELRVEGGFAVEVDGRPVTEWPQRCAAELVKLLA
jgi:hypothetical protein